MNTFFPPIEAYNSGFLKVSNLHTIYFEECGSPKGKPIIFLHGGPGGGISEEHRRFFDPKEYRIILFDQRGCGKSTPFAELNENTTWDLVADIEKLRNHLAIDKWAVFGGSWGSTLALAYGVTHPERCVGFILRGIFLCRKWEINWFYQEGASLIYPDQWEVYWNQIAANERTDMVSAYYKQLTSTDEKLKLKAAKVWSTWEASTSKLIPDSNFISEYEEAEKALPFARIECHYFINKAFFPTDNYLLEQVHKINHLPCHIVHGRYDIVCPPKNAWELHKLWPTSKLFYISDSGHSAMEKGILHQLIAATESAKSWFK
ncbi:MAG: prolyl aminopeptidase [Bdellovibrionaceae bacterium]|nr:prolyl aminopeptidase [Pseudobdellovibrionaceae bacterium]NUM58882.1 prolyl aminopeptidase [Pseudobdellovibrionaceae bacterium]